MTVYVILCLVDGCDAHEEPCGLSAHVQAVCTARDNAERLMELHRRADSHGGPADVDRNHNDKPRPSASGGRKRRRQ